jgi:hypothetical protein
MIEVLKQALEALYPISHNSTDDYRGQADKVITSIRQAIAELESQEPVAWMFQHDETGRMNFVESQQIEHGWEKGNPRYKKIGPLYTHPPQRTWVGLMRGVRVEGDTVVISVHYGNDAARQVCGALIEEMNT